MADKQIFRFVHNLLKIKIKKIEKTTQLTEPENI